MASSMSIAEVETFVPCKDEIDGQPAKPIDLVHLSHYTLGDSTLEREILQLFRAQSRIYLERLRDACGKADWREAAHTIKGSARGIGAWQVAEFAEKAEIGKSGVDKTALADLEASIIEANAFIKTLLADH